MLENCKTLQDCETILSGLLNKVKYIGQVDLSLNDLTVLDNLILSYIDIVGLESAAYFMQKHIPVSTAFYLVYKGVWGYEGGNYWASLSDALSLNDPTSQAEWGSWFLDFLEKNNLIQFDTEGTYRYVSPILLHGGIPQNSVEEFIEKVVIPLVNRGFKEEEEVKDFLFGFRKREQEKRELQRGIDELHIKAQYAENNAHYWYKFMEYRKLAKELSERIGDFAHICPWPKNLSEIYTANRRKIILLEEEIRILEEEYNVNLEILSNYTQVESQILYLEPMMIEIKTKFQNILECSSDIDKLINYKKEYEKQLNQIFINTWYIPWKKEYGEQLEALNIRALENNISEYDKQAAILKKLKQDEVKLKSQKPPHNFSLKTAIGNIIAGLIFSYAISSFTMSFLMFLPIIIMSVISFISLSGYAKWKKQKEMSVTKINQNINEKINNIDKLNQELKIILKDIYFIDHFLTDPSGSSDLLGFSGILDLPEYFRRNLKALTDNWGIYRNYAKTVQEKEILEIQIRDRYKKAQQEIAALQTTISEIAAFKIETSEIIASIDEDVNPDSYQNCIIEHIKEYVKEWEQALEDAGMKYRKAQKAEHQIRREVKPKILMKCQEKDYIIGENKKIEEYILSLGSNDLERGFLAYKMRWKEYEELQNIQDYIKNIISNNSTTNILDEIPDEELNNVLSTVELSDNLPKDEFTEYDIKVNRLYRESLKQIEKLQSDIKQKDSRIKELSSFVQYTEGTIKHFLIYGDEWAENSLSGLVQLVYDTFQKGNYPSEEYLNKLCLEWHLSERYIQGFQSWWRRQLRVEADEEYREDGVKNESIKQSAGHFISPILALDPVFGEIKIIVSSQRIPIFDDNLSDPVILKISEVSGLKKEPEKESKAESKEVLREESKEGVNEVLEKETVLINLKTYLRREEGLIETKEEEYILSEIAKQYVISLCIGAEIYRTWEIDCIDEGSPYIIFNEKGIRISNDKCPDRPVWFLLKSGFEFESGIPIIEERIGLNITGDYRLLFVDLTGITQFALKIKGKIEEDEKYIKEHDGTKYTNMEYISMINTGLRDPYLNGGHILPQVKILESPVYTQKPEKIIVPIDKEIGITGWTFMIRQGIGKSCSRRYYRIQDLKGIEAFHGKGYVEIPLNTDQLLGENPIGWYTFCFRSPKRKEIYLNCAVISGLKIVFKPQLHFPSNQFEEPGEEASLSIISPEGTSFILERPSRILAAQERVYDIRIPWNVDVAKGVVSVLASNKTNNLDKVDDLSKLDKAVDLNKADVDDMNIMGDLDKVDILYEIDRLDKIGEDKENLPIKIELPNVKWRIYGLKSNFMKGDFNDEAKDDGVKDSILKNNSYEDWNIYEKEIWIGDWEQYEKVQIHIKVPIESAYCYRFYLEDLKDGLEHYIDGKLIDGKSVIELLEFTDTIRRNPGLSRFCMEVYDQRLLLIGKGRIFTLRSKWEVEDIICQVSGSEDKIYLYCQWKDLGKVENRVLRLWKCWKPWEKPLIYNIPDGKNTIEIKEAKSKLIPGKYIIQFDIEDPWLSNDNHLFPEEEFSNIQHLYIQDKEPYIHTELKVTWPNEKKAIIEGKTVGIQNGQQISAFLLGIHRGQAIVCQGISTILSGGDFSIHIDQTQYCRQTQYLSQNQYLEQTKYTEQIKHFNNTVPKLKNFAHWVILKVDNTILTHPPIYTAVILQQPNTLEYQLNWVRKKQLAMQKYIKQVDIIDKKGLVIYKLLNVKQLYRIINAWVKGEREVVLTVKVKGRDQGIQVSFDHNTGKCYIGIQKGIRCTSCGAFLPNQEVWHREHYPKCKSFIFRYTKLLEISILLMLDFESHILRLKKLYPLAGDEPLELYSNKHDQLPDYLWMGKNKFSHDNRDKYEKIVNLLIDKEVGLLNKVEKSIQSFST